MKYGEWPSPISAALLAQGSIRFGEIALCAGEIYWLESCNQEKGRISAFRQKTNGEVENLLASEFNVRTRVHEYGGGAFTVSEKAVYFSNDADRQLYVLERNRTPHKITEYPNWRFADFMVDNVRQRLISVAEDHSNTTNLPKNVLVSIPLDSSKPMQILADGHDFYSNPVMSKDGKRLAFLSWNLPNMPWNSTSLWVAELNEDGNIGKLVKVAGSSTESIFQPQWGEKDELFFVSDRNGWWNIYRYTDNQIELVLEMAAEFGLPQWVFGMSTYAIIDQNHLAAAYSKDGEWHIGIIDICEKQIKELEIPYTYITQVRADTRQIVFQAASPTHPTQIVRYRIESNHLEIIRSSISIEIDKRYWSIPRKIHFHSDGVPIQGFYYPPYNPEIQPDANDKPPLLIFCHSGPTGATDNSLSLKIQYWTSRGFAVLDVNYRGSTGFGRAFREALQHQWGISDVKDCINGAKYLISAGEVDSKKIAMSGSSAGGFTALTAMITYPELIAAGCSKYGVSDLIALSEHTHKFELKYNDWLIAPYPEKIEEYRKRSPIQHIEALKCPLLIMQGGEDKIVLPEQSEKLSEALKSKNIPVAYVLFPDEGHGFRNPENILKAIEMELYFYCKIFKLLPNENLTPVVIYNV